MGCRSPTTLYPGPYGVPKATQGETLFKKILFLIFSSYCYKCFSNKEKKKPNYAENSFHFSIPSLPPRIPRKIFTFCHYTYGPVFLTLRASSFSKELQMAFLLLILKTLSVNSGCHLSVLFVFLIFLAMCPDLTQSGCILALCVQSCHQKAAPYLNLLWLFSFKIPH